MNTFTKVLVAPLILVVVVLLIPIVPLALICWIVASAVISIAVSVFWIPKGIRFLIIYSESEQWKSYFQEEVLPVFGQTARVVNLSRDGGSKKWWHLDWWIYKHCAGYTNRFPIVFRFSPFWTWKTVRFFDAFIQSKKEKNSALEKAKSDLTRWHPKNL